MIKCYWYVTKKRLDVSPIPEVNYDVIYAEEGIPEKDPTIDVVSKHKRLEDVAIILANIKGNDYQLVKGK